MFTSVLKQASVCDNDRQEVAQSNVKKTNIVDLIRTIYGSMDNLYLINENQLYVETTALSYTV